METWITSDVHVGHRYMLQKERKMFSSIEQHDEWIVEAWNSLIAPSDEVFVLGDVGLCPRPRLVEVASRLHGRKKVVPGNHDSKTLLNGLAGIGWEILAPLVRRHLPDFGKVTMCHFPMVTWVGRRQLAVHMHGHSHSTTPLWEGRFKDGATNGVRVDVGFEGHKMTPWHTLELHDFLAKEMERVAAVFVQTGEAEGPEM